MFTQPIDQIYLDEKDILNISLDLSYGFPARHEYIDLENKDLYEMTTDLKPYTNLKSLNSQRKKNKFKFKYLLRPKWEETISKMKTIYFISVKTMVKRVLDFFTRKFKNEIDEVVY
jgi:hypothetical protein